MLRLYQGIMNGPEIADLPVRADLSWTEGFAIAPLVLALVLIGINPHALTTFDPTLYSVAAASQGVGR
jgi:NADH:ubiquinone oxidoreductase subunit 4 (subunit M)